MPSARVLPLSLRPHALHEQLLVHMPTDERHCAPYPLAPCLQALYEELLAGAQQVFLKHTMQGRLQHSLTQIKASH